jgi:hypothetical protein
MPTANQIATPTVVMVPFTTLQVGQDHRFNGLVVACAMIQGANYYLCRDGVFRVSALPFELQGTNRETALVHPESAYYNDKAEIVLVCQALGFQTDPTGTLSQPTPPALPEATAAAERELLLKLLEKHGDPRVAS